MDKFQILCWISAEICLKCIILLTNFQRSPSAGAFRPQRSLSFDFGTWRLRVLAKLWFSNWLWRNRTSKNQLWLHQNNVTRHSILCPSQSKFLVTPAGLPIYFHLIVAQPLNTYY